MIVFVTNENELTTRQTHEAHLIVRYILEGEHKGKYQILKDRASSTVCPTYSSRRAVVSRIMCNMDSVFEGRKAIAETMLSDNAHE